MKSLMIFFLMLFLISPVFAMSGVSPGSYEVHFEPGLEQDFSFEFFFDEGVSSSIYIEGDLAEYVDLNKNIIYGSEEIIATLALPDEIKTPGSNLIRIGARQDSVGGGVGLVADVRGIIRIEVPYPGKYVELKVDAKNANVEEDVNLFLEAYNRGDEEVNLFSQIQIFRDDNEGVLLDRIEFLEVRLLSGEKVNFTSLLDTTKYLSGDYVVTALGDYGGENLARDDDPFRLGEFYVGILNYTSSFEGGKIERFSIFVESFWNNDIEELYAEVNILGLEDAGFITPAVKLNAWEKGRLEGFLDTSEISGEDFQAEIILHYGGGETKEIVNLKISKNFDYMFPAIIILLILSLVLLKRLNVFGKLKKLINKIK